MGENLDFRKTTIVTGGSKFQYTQETSNTYGKKNPTWYCIEKLQPVNANEVRLRICNIIKIQRPIKQNVPSDEWKVLTLLRNDKLIHVTNADQNKVTVILNNSDCEPKLRQHLKNGTHEVIEEKDNNVPNKQVPFRSKG